MNLCHIFQLTLYISMSKYSVCVTDELCLRLETTSVVHYATYLSAAVFVPCDISTFQQSSELVCYYIAVHRFGQLPSSTKQQCLQISSCLRAFNIVLCEVIKWLGQEYGIIPQYQSLTWIEKLMAWSSQSSTHNVSVWETAAQ